MSVTIGVGTIICGGLHFIDTKLSEMETRIYALLDFRTQRIEPSKTRFAGLENRFRHDFQLCKRKKYDIFLHLPSRFIASKPSSSHSFKSPIVYDVSDRVISS